MQLGFKSVTMNDLAKELGMSKKTLYNFYPNKDALVGEVMQLVSDRIQNIITQIQEQNLNPIHELFTIRREINAMIPHEQEDACIYQLSKYYPEQYEQFHERQMKMILQPIERNIRRGQNLGVYLSDIAVAVYAKFFYMGMIGLKSEELNGDLSASKLKHEYLMFFLRGICNAEGAEELHQINTNPEHLLYEILD